MPGNLEQRIRRAEAARAVAPQQTMATRRAQLEREQAYRKAHPEQDEDIAALARALLVAVCNGTPEEAAAAERAFMDAQAQLERDLATWPA